MHICSWQHTTMTNEDGIYLQHSCSFNKIWFEQIDFDLFVCPRLAMLRSHLIGVSMPKWPYLKWKIFNAQWHDVIVVGAFFFFLLRLGPSGMHFNIKRTGSRTYMKGYRNVRAVNHVMPLFICFFFVVVVIIGFFFFLLLLIWYVSSNCMWRTIYTPDMCTTTNVVFKVG